MEKGIKGVKTSVALVIRKQFVIIYINENKKNYAYIGGQ